MDILLIPCGSQHETVYLCLPWKPKYIMNARLYLIPWTLCLNEGSSYRHGLGSRGYPLRFSGVCIPEEIIRSGPYLYSGRNGDHDLRPASTCLHLLLCICLLHVPYMGRISVFLPNHFSRVSPDVYLHPNLFYSQWRQGFRFFWAELKHRRN